MLDKAQLQRLIKAYLEYLYGPPVTLIFANAKGESRALHFDRGRDN